MKTIFVDFDGVLVYNILKDFNISKNSEVDNAKILRTETTINLDMINRIKEWNENGYSVKIMTGRKEYLLGDFTKNLLNSHGIQNMIIFYPKGRGYGTSEYFGYKEEHIKNALQIGFVELWDDDLKLLHYLREQIKSNFLKLIYYEYTPTKITTYIPI